VTGGSPGAPAAVAGTRWLTGGVELLVAPDVEEDAAVGGAGSTPAADEAETALGVGAGDANPAAPHPASRVAATKTPSTGLRPGESS
jgi:hypothetical protein